MKSKKPTPKDILEQGLISSVSPVQFLKNNTRDARTRKSTQRAARDFFEGKTSREAGEQLGVSYQRATAIRRGIEKGQIYSPELRDLLQENVKEGEKPYRLEAGVWYFPDEKQLNKIYKTERIKGFAELDDAEDFWNTVIGSEKYIVIVRQKGKTPRESFYQVVGLGSRAERPRTYKAKKSGRKYKRTEKRGEMRLDQIRKKYEKSL